MVTHRRSFEREKKYNDDKVCGITFEEIVKEAIEIAKCGDFIPPISGYFTLPSNSVFENKFALIICEFTAFAAMNILRRRNGLEPMTDISALEQLADLPEMD